MRLLDIIIAKQIKEMIGGDGGCGHGSGAYALRRIGRGAIEWGGNLGGLVRRFSPGDYSEIDATYRTIPDRDHRAWRCDRWGARTTFQITQDHLEKFAQGDLSAPFGYPAIPAGYGGLLVSLMNSPAGPRSVRQVGVRENTLGRGKISPTLEVRGHPPRPISRPRNGQRLADLAQESVRICPASLQGLKVVMMVTCSWRLAISSVLLAWAAAGLATGASCEPRVPSTNRRDTSIRKSMRPTATFRISAPNAQQVLLDLSGRHAMARDDNGVWTITTSPWCRGFTILVFIVDGVARRTRTARATWHGPDGQRHRGTLQGENFYDANNVPTAKFASGPTQTKTTREQRKVWSIPRRITTRTRTPVIPCCTCSTDTARIVGHGGGRAGELHSGQSAGRRQAKPMIVVMEMGELHGIWRGRGNPPATSTGPPIAGVCATFEAAP